MYAKIIYRANPLGIISEAYSCFIRTARLQYNEELLTRAIYEPLLTMGRGISSTVAANYGHSQDKLRGPLI